MTLSKDYIIFRGAQIITKENFPIPGYHYALIYRGEGGFNALYGTSNGLFMLQNSQDKYPPLPSLMKEGAIDPSTILCKNIKSHLFMQRTKIVSKGELLSALMEDYYLMGLDIKDYRMMYSKMNAFHEVMIKHGVKKEDVILRQLTGDYYLSVIIDRSQDSIIKEIMSFERHHD
jgi:hypothetical protein